MMIVPVKEMFLGATMRLLSVTRIPQIAIIDPNTCEHNTLYSQSCNLRLDVSDLGWMIRCFPFARVAYVENIE